MSANTIETLRIGLLRRFALFALACSLLVFLLFAMRLILEEEHKIDRYLQSFSEIAERTYKLQPLASTMLSNEITAYYGQTQLPESLQAQLPMPLDQISRNYQLFGDRKHRSESVAVYHFEFEYNGRSIPAYLTINPFTLDFGDDVWDSLLAIALLLTLFLLLMLRRAITRAFDQLMQPISQLSQQLNQGDTERFSVADEAIDELQQLTQSLNDFAEMKERVAKQEMMFANFASHELKTPIAVILGAANLQQMDDDPAFQAKQNRRIIAAASEMQTTVELLLSIVKQENASSADHRYPVCADDIDLTSQQPLANEGVAVTLTVSDDCSINFPLNALQLIINNLLSNALRHTLQGSIAVNISNRNISVIDSGSGLNDQQPCQHGLGLVIVRRLCDSYGWDFSLSNRSDSTGCIATLKR